MEKISIDQAYSSEPWWYDARGFLILTFAYRSSLQSQIRLFGKNIGPEHLEVAIGSGTLFDLILKYRNWKGLPVTNVVGFDYAEQMLIGARKRFSKKKQITLLKADAAALPLQANTFDTANIANAIHCLPEIEASLLEIHRVLKENGRLAGNCLLYPKGKGLLDLISTRINNWGIKKGILNRPYYATEIRQILKNCGFSIEYEQISGNCYNFIAKKISS